MTKHINKRTKAKDPEGTGGKKDRLKRQKNTQENDKATYMYTCVRQMNQQLLWSSYIERFYT